MKTNYKLTLAALAGVSLGVSGATVIHARQARVPPAYVISEVDQFQDLPTLQKYGGKVEDTLTPFNHHFIVRGGVSQALEGEPPKGFVVLAFDSAEKAREWYYSPAYQVIKSFRQNSTKGRFFIVEGVVPR